MGNRVGGSVTLTLTLTLTPRTYKTFNKHVGKVWRNEKRNRVDYRGRPWLAIAVEGPDDANIEIQYSVFLVTDAGPMRRGKSRVGFFSRSGVFASDAAGVRLALRLTFRPPVPLCIPFPLPRRNRRLIRSLGVHPWF